MVRKDFPQEKLGESLMYCSELFVLEWLLCPLEHFIPDTVQGGSRRRERAGFAE